VGKAENSAGESFKLGRGESLRRWTPSYEKWDRGLARTGWLWEDSLKGYALALGGEPTPALRGERLLSDKLKEGEALQTGKVFLGICESGRRVPQ